MPKFKISFDYNCALGTSEACYLPSVEREFDALAVAQLWAEAVAEGATVRHSHVTAADCHYSVREIVEIKPECWVCVVVNIRTSHAHTYWGTSSAIVLERAQYLCSKFNNNQMRALPPVRITPDPT